MMKIPNLPDDLESEILCRVPAKSLTKLKTTCKRWHALFRDPRFVKQNLGKSAREVMLLMNHRVHSISVNRHGIHDGVDASMEFSGKLIRLSDSKDVKKLRVAVFEIYDFGSDSWRVLDDDMIWGIFSAGVSLNGDTFWIGGDKETGFFLMYFDFTTERFGRFPLPYQSFDYEDIAVLSLVREEKLSLLNQNLHRNSSEMKIWVTNKFDEAKDLSWSQFLVVDFDKFTLPYVNSVISFFLDEESKVAVCCYTDMEDEERTKIYIVGVDLYKEVYKEVTKGSILNWPCFVSYAPNLVHIQKTSPKGKKKMREKEVTQMNHLSTDGRQTWQEALTQSDAKLKSNAYPNYVVE
ncbi:hypothetical protein ARALYDRAFT_479202 [Arabidopsis lyrata subsp. lyrata]|uniref:F-box domain-containing protein n=1 Tax=Arabidopsis lyrata subsp. lyrata TaxID=81972 RepID=D7L6Q7_ARALL|nr:hypothetical protein ARALYDRAFT_479202 [Arabidopsis lyrata subsp. lyrata]